MTTPAPSITGIQFEPAVHITIRVNPDHVKVWPLKTDADLLVETGEDSFLASVPMHALNADHTSVAAARVGRMGKKIIVAFPPSNLGTSILHIPEDKFPGILVN